LEFLRYFKFVIYLSTISRGALDNVLRNGGWETLECDIQSWFHKSGVFRDRLSSYQLCKDGLSLWVYLPNITPGITSYISSAGGVSGEQNNKTVRFQVLTAASMKLALF
jgi:hypothetical protein